MGKALADALQYTSGLLLSPIPIAAMIVLLMGGGTVRPLGFGVVWVATTFTAVLLLAIVVEPPSGGASEGERPEWADWVTLAIGVLLLGLAVLSARKLRRHARHGSPEPPGWMRAMDSLPVAKVLALAAILVLVNPINFSMVLGAGVTIGSYSLPAGDDAVVAAIFTLVGSLGVLAPLVLRVAVGAELEPRLVAARRWLVAHDDVLSFGMFLIFGLDFVGQGLRGVIG